MVESAVMFLKFASGSCLFLQPYNFVPYFRSPVIGFMKGEFYHKRILSFSHCSCKITEKSKIEQLALTYNRLNLLLKYRLSPPLTHACIVHVYKD